MRIKDQQQACARLKAAYGGAGESDIGDQSAIRRVVIANPPPEPSSCDSGKTSRHATVQYIIEDIATRERRAVQNMPFLYANDDPRSLAVRFPPAGVRPLCREIISVEPCRSI